MTDKDIRDAVASASMIVGGYAFVPAEGGYIRVIDIHEPFHVAVMNADGEVTETDMDGIALSIVMDYWHRNSKYMEARQEPKKTNKSWEGFLKWQGSVIVNDPTLLI